MLKLCNGQVQSLCKGRLHWIQLQVMELSNSMDIVILTATGQTGGLADHVVVDAQQAIPLPDSIPLDVGGEIEHIPFQVLFDLAQF